MRTDEQLKIQKMLMYFWIAVFFLVKALRWDTGTDFPQFLACWQNSSWSNIFSYWRYGQNSELMEPGYVFLNVLVKTFIPHYSVFLILTNAFIMFSFVKLIDKYVVRFKLVAFAMLMVCAEMFPVRQTIATAVIVWTYMFMHEKKLKKYSVAMLISFLIHKSSVILYPLYWIQKIKPNIKLFIVVYLFLCASRQLLMDKLIGLFNVKAFSVVVGNVYRVNDLIDLGAFSVVSVVNSVAHLLLFGYVLRLFVQRNFNEKFPRIYSFYVISVSIYFVMICLNVVGSIPGLDIVYRLCNNFLIVYPITVAMTIWALFYYRNKLFAVFVYSCLFALKFMANPCVDENGIYYTKCYYPYYTVFETTEEKLIRSLPWPYRN